MEEELRADPGDIAMSFPHRAAPVVAPLRYVLPFPPSVNRYYRHVGYRTLLSREGREYRAMVLSLLAGRPASRWPRLSRSGLYRGGIATRGSKKANSRGQCL